MDHDLLDTMFNNNTNETSTVGEDPGSTSWAEDLKTVYFSMGPAFFWTLLVTGGLGITGNILTLLVYARLGFAAHINISYSAMAVSDLLCVLSSMLVGFRFLAIPLPNLSLKVTEELTKLVGAYPHYAFSRVTGLLTAWISLERCLCVIYPTRVKLIISRGVTKLAICICYVLGCLPLVFLYALHRMKIQVDPILNVTTLVVLQKTGQIEGVLEGTALLLSGVVYPVLSCVTVTVCTAALITKLRQTTKWRRLNGASGARAGSANQDTEPSTREIRVTRAVVTVAVVFLICSIPTATHLLAIFTVKGYTSTGYLRYLRSINGMFILLFAHINSSLNIVIFTIIGQKFRAVLLQTLTPSICRR